MMKIKLEEKEILQACEEWMNRHIFSERRAIAKKVTTASMDNRVIVEIDTMFEKNSPPDISRKPEAPPAPPRVNK